MSSVSPVSLAAYMKNIMRSVCQYVNVIEGSFSENICEHGHAMFKWGELDVFIN